MTESLPRISAKMTLLDKTMASNAVIMKDNNIPAPATPASLDVGAVAFRLQSATSNKAMIESNAERVNERLVHAKKRWKSSPRDGQKTETETEIKGSKSNWGTNDCYDV